MKLLSFCRLSCALIATTLAGCSSMSALHDKLADMQLQKKQLANGKTVFVDVNVLPAGNWQCTMIDVPQYYNWAQIRMVGQFQLSGRFGLLTQKALDYANQRNLDINYINLGVPTENTFSTGHGRLSEYDNLNPDAQAVVSYYNCRQINPEHRLGYQEKNDISVRVGN